MWTYIVSKDFMARVTTAHLCFKFSEGYIWFLQHSEAQQDIHSQLIITNPMLLAAVSLDANSIITNNSSTMHLEEKTLLVLAHCCSALHGQNNTEQGVICSANCREITFDS